MVRAVLRDSELLLGKADGMTYRRENRTENYVESPPAYIITAPDGTTFTLGNRYRQYGMTYEFNVRCNDINTTEYASKIILDRGKVKIFGRDGLRVWTGKSFI